MLANRNQKMPMTSAIVTICATMPRFRSSRHQAGRSAGVAILPWTSVATFALQRVGNRNARQQFPPGVSISSRSVHRRGVLQAALGPEGVQAALQLQLGLRADIA